MYKLTPLPTDKLALRKRAAAKRRAIKRFETRFGPGVKLQADVFRDDTYITPDGEERSIKSIRYLTTWLQQNCRSEVLRMPEFQWYDTDGSIHVGRLWYFFFRDPKEAMLFKLTW